MPRHTSFQVDGRPFLSLGGQARNSSARTPEDAEHACRAVSALGGNTVAFPIAWEWFEPREGEFDAGFVHELIDRARRWGLRMTVLWFGTWKNGTMEYCPPWVKRDRERFPRVRYRGGEEAFVLSAHERRNLEADATAFCTLMRTIREHDAEGTVIGVQIENEPGIYAPTRRDFGEAAEADLAVELPTAVVAAAAAAPDTPLGRIWRRAGAIEQGNWIDVLGAYGAEACTTWHVARYVDEIARRAREVHDLPYFVNAWADEGTWGLGGLDFPSGGPTHVTPALDIWRTAAGHLDLICPDIYVADPDGYRTMVAAYAAPGDGWPLFVPESANRHPNPAFMFHTIGEPGALGQHVFAIEELVDETGALLGDGAAFRDSFAMIGAIAPLLAADPRRRSTHTVVQQPGQRLVRVPVEGWMCTALFTGPAFGWNGTDFRHMEQLGGEFVQRTDVAAELGRAIVVQTAPDEFHLVGQGVRFLFHPLPPEDGSVPYSLISPAHEAAALPSLHVDEGRADEDGVFVPLRARSGDESRHGTWTAADCGVVRVVLTEV